MDTVKPNGIFISINRNFLETLKVCLLSILQNYPNHPDIILCHTDLIQKELRELLQITEKIIPIKNNLEPQEIWPIMWHLPVSIDPKVFYARFLLRKWGIFNNYNNILHLDADTLVVGNLDQLMSKNIFYAIEEAYQGEDKIFKDHNDIQLQKQLYRDNLVIGNKASNGGVFLLPPEYRTPEHYHDIISLLSWYAPYIKRADQSILNIRMYKNNIPIQKDFTYNFQHRLLEHAKNNAIADKASIIHFNGVSDIYRLDCMKKYLFLSQNNKWADMYREYFNSLSGK